MISTFVHAVSDFNASNTIISLRGYFSFTKIDKFRIPVIKKDAIIMYKFATLYR